MVGLAGGVMLESVRFEEYAHVRDGLDGATFSRFDSVPLEYRIAEKRVLRQANQWIVDNPTRKIINFQGPFQEPLGDSRSGSGKVVMIVLHEELALKT